jgi:hypothetical protein
MVRKLPPFAYMGGLPLNVEADPKCDTLPDVIN